VLVKYVLKQAFLNILSNLTKDLTNYFKYYFDIVLLHVLPLSLCCHLCRARPKKSLKHYNT